MEEVKRCCGTCRFNTPIGEGDFVCDNEDGFYYSDYVDYDYKCPDWEEKSGDISGVS